MSKPLPSDALYYRDDNFYELVKDRCGNDMVEFMKILNISSVQSLLGVENIFSWLEFNSEQLHLIKNKLAFQHDNGCIEIKWGVRNSLECLIRDLQRVHDYIQPVTESGLSKDHMILSSVFLKKYPVLKSLIRLYQASDTENSDDRSEDISFLTSVLDNISNNLSCSKNAYRHNEHVLRFAAAFYVLGGRMAYEFVRLNVPGILPSISTLRRLHVEKELRINEAEFRYDLLVTHMNSLQTTVAFASEDCTAVIKKISYDSHTNSFVGLSTPLNNGIPIKLYYQTDSFDKLREWFSNVDRAPLINIQMVQPVTKSHIIPTPFLLCAFGTTNKCESIDIIRRWLWIFEESLLRNIRIIGFSTDGDPKYLRAMRLVTGWFASLPNTQLNNHKDAFRVNIPKEWNWYFLGDRQLFLCFQDATHLCTKLRNRLLSHTTTLLIGKSCVSMDHLSILIQKVSKLRHGLIKSDIFLHDRQNFNSCMKICSESVINSLVDVPNSQGTVIYLRLIRSIMIAYIDKETSPIDRLYHAWFSVFFCRWWYFWLHNTLKDELDKTLLMSNHVVTKKKKQDNKKQFFISNNAYYSIEINAHQLTYLSLLVTENKLPMEAIHIDLFSSQSCEGMFRSARSMSGTFSSVVNFNVQEFLNRAQKLSMLQKIKAENEFYSSDSMLRFPTHHKQRKRLKMSCEAIPNSSLLSMEMIKNTVSQAFDDVTNLLITFGIKTNLDEKKVADMNQFSHCIRELLKTRTNMNNFSRIFEGIEKIPTLEHDIDNEQSEIIDTWQNKNVPVLHDTEFNGMRLFDTVSKESIKSYFQVEINGKKKYIHKQTACWLLTEEKMVLSNDRLIRVMRN